MHNILKKDVGFYQKHFTKLLFFVVSAVILQVIVPWPLRFLVDSVLENQPIQQDTIPAALFSLFSTKVSLGGFLVFVYLFLRLVLNLVEYFKAIVTKKAVGDVIYRFSKKAFENLERLSMGFYRNQVIGDYMYRLSYDVSALGEYIEQGLLPFIQSALYITLVTIVLFFMDIQLGLLTLFTLPILFVCLSFTNKNIAAASKKSEYWNSAIFSFMQQALSQLKIIQTYTKEESELHTFNKKMHSLLKARENLSATNVITTFFTTVVIAICYAGVLWMGVTLLFQGELSAGSLLLFIIYLDSLTAPLLALLYSYGIMKGAHVKVSRAESYFAQKLQIEDSGTIDMVDDTTISMKNISVRSIKDTAVITDASFTIPEGKITAIAGLSGSGKSTLLTLIPRLTEPKEGKIMLGGHPVTSYTIKALRDAIAYVPQEHLLFNRSIRDIIAFGKAHGSFEEVKRAAHLAVADEFIEKLPGKYDYKIGEDGASLSAGQRQRLMLARAYMKDAKILLLDEVFSSQDAMTRMAMVTNFKFTTHGKTIVIVTNEDDIISEADQVVVFREGTVVDVYQHDELVEKKLLRQPHLNEILLGKKIKKSSK